MNDRELWTDPGFMQMVIDYIGSHFERCKDWPFEDAISNPAGLASEMHKIAGSAGMFGFPRMGEAARALEEAIRGGSPEHVFFRLFHDLKNQVKIAHEEARSFARANGLDS